MNRRLAKIGLAIGLATAAPLAVISSSASANTAIMGSTLASDFDGPGSGGEFSINARIVSAQISFDPGTSPNPVVSPANGVITGWKVKSAVDGAHYTLKVLRPNGPVSLVVAADTNFTGIASAQAPSATPAGTFIAHPTGAIFSYPASLPISKGDYIGLFVGPDSPFPEDLPQHGTSGVHANLIGNNFLGQPADGSSAPLTADEQHELLLQATVQFCSVPPLKKLKAKAAKRALRAHDCQPKVKKRIAKKNKLRGKVLKQKTPAGTTAPPGTVVPIVIGKKG
jgi:PASTA domain-containing protein